MTADKRKLTIIWSAKESRKLMNQISNFEELECDKSLYINQ